MQATPREQALLRLAASRQALQQTWLPAPQAPRHTARQALALARQLGEQAAPWIRRHPAHALGLAAAAGAALVTARRWTLPLLLASADAVPNHLKRWAVASLVQQPMQALLAGWLAAAAAPSPRNPDEPSAP